MTEIVFATNNKHKLDEIRQIAGDRISILSLADIGCRDDIPEDGLTLEENALIKARWVKEKYGYDCFADDTGLEVESLNGEPGVRSARYASVEGHDSQANMKLLLKNMEGKSNRDARFRTVIALIKGNEEKLVEGVVEGTIIEKGRGKDGFGYDPIFQPTGFDITFAEMDPAQKNAISHRGRAMKKLLPLLK